MLFRGKYAFLSNFYNAPIKYKDKEYLTSEHLYQACKTDLEDERKWVRSAPTPEEAKRRGKQVTLRSDWNQIKISAMRGILKLKFTQHPDLMKQLKAIHEPLVEDNTWGDKFWGRVNGIGHNHLGKLLDEIRSK